MIQTLLSKWRGMGLLAWCESEYGWIAENGKPIVLSDWQRAVLSEYLERQEDTSTLLISSVKKCGKTLLNSLILCYRWLTVEYPNLHLSLGNDKDQSAELQVTMIANMCKRHPVLSRYVKVTRNELTLEPTGSRIVALPMDWEGSGGGNFSTVSFSELWAYVHEGNRRLFEELTPIPHIDCLRVIDSYAGYTAESELLASLWQRGESGKRVNTSWPIYKTGGQLSYIHQGEDAQARCWRGSPAKRKVYYEEQRATLREGTYRRLHLNEWASSEDVFIPPELWEMCFDLHSKPLLPGTGTPVYCGVDAACKVGGDDAAVIGVYRDPQGYVRVAWYRVWRGKTRTRELRLDHTVEPYLVEQASKYNIQLIAYDPRYMTNIANRLRDRRFPMIEIVQSLPILGLLGQNLYSIIQDGRLRFYPSEDLKNMAGGVVGKEVANGLHIRKGAGKADLMVSLSFACSALLVPDEVETETVIYPHISIEPGYVGQAVDLLPFFL